jgi:DNA-binding response OmpR family regulator
MIIVTNSKEVRACLNGHHSVDLFLSDSILTEWYDPKLFDVVIVDVDTIPPKHTPLVFKANKNTLPIIGIQSEDSFEICASERRAIFIEQGGGYLLNKPIHQREVLACIQALDDRLNRTRSTVSLCADRLVIAPVDLSVLFDGKKYHSPRLS